MRQRDQRADAELDRAETKLSCVVAPSMTIDARRQMAAKSHAAASARNACGSPLISG